MNNNEISFLVLRPKVYYKPLLGHMNNSQLLYLNYYFVFCTKYIILIPLVNTFVGNLYT